MICSASGWRQVRGERLIEYEHSKAQCRRLPAYKTRSFAGSTRTVSGICCAVEIVGWRFVVSLLEASI